MKKLSSTFIAASLSTALFLAVPVAGMVISTPAAAVPAFDFTDLVEKTSSAVVNIRTTQKVSINQSGNPADEQMQELFRRFFGVPIPQQPAPGTAPRKRKAPQAEGSEEEVPRGIGSGFIIFGIIIISKS